MTTTTEPLAVPSASAIARYQDAPLTPRWVSLDPFSTPALLYEEHTDAVSSLAWSPDGTRIASCSWDGTVRVWEAASGRGVLPSLSLGLKVLRLAWSPDGRYLVTIGEDGFGCTWRVGSAALADMGLRFDQVREAAFSPDGSLLALGHLDGSVELRMVGGGDEWGAVSSFSLAQVLRWHCGGSSLEAVHNRVCALAFSPEGDRLAVGALDDIVSIHDPRTGEQVFTRSGCWKKAVLSLAWAPNGKCIANAATDRWLRVWSAQDGDPVWQEPVSASWVKRVAWAPNGGRIASACDDGMVQVWEAASGRLAFAYRAHSKSGDALAWSPDGRSLASAGADGTVLIADMPG